MMASITMNQWFLVAVAFIGLLWSDSIADDVPHPQEIEQIAKPTSPPQSPESTKNLRAPRFPRGTLPTADGSGVNRKAFLAAFHRQANTELDSCFRLVAPSPSSITLVATLNKFGTLSNLHALDTSHRSSLPECLRTNILKMDFANAAKSMTRETVTVEWRIDW